MVEQIQINEVDNRIIYVPAQLKYWADEMYSAEFDGKWRYYHEAKRLYKHYKKLSDEGVDYDPTF
tara:strand:+ start:903 stop:1097 length:195 start_codon:yes stop_codon:yes gene_type:complete